MPRKIDRRWFSLLMVGVLAVSLVPVFASQDGERPTRRPGPAAGERVRAVQVPVKVLLVTGQNNHDWARTSPMVVAILEDAGDRFVVETTTTPRGGGDDAGWATWRPAFSEYDLVVSDYNGHLWPLEVRESFEQYIDDGGKALLLHAANNAFTGWTEYEEMTGLLWRDAGFGDRLYYNDAGELVRVPAGEGSGAGHGQKHDWPITHRAEHPVLEGLPTTWMHAYDELYHNQRGPARNMTILATAYDDPAHGGTGQHEPMIWTIPYGEGVVMTFLPGHLWAGQQDETAFRCVGYRTLLQRSCEWLATGEVTLPVPDNFPTATQKSVLPE
ncbi:MAG: ThuA domain-containing protein [Phycisphaerales bacterium JB063]